MRSAAVLLAALFPAIPAWCVQRSVPQIELKIAAPVVRPAALAVNATISPLAATAITQLPDVAIPKTEVAGVKNSKARLDARGQAKSVSESPDAGKGFDGLNIPADKSVALSVPDIQARRDIQRLAAQPFNDPIYGRPYFKALTKPKESSIKKFGWRARNSPRPRCRTGTATGTSRLKLPPFQSAPAGRTAAAVPDQA